MAAKVGLMVRDSPNIEERLLNKKKTEGKKKKKKKRKSHTCNRKMRMRDLVIKVRLIHPFLSLFESNLTHPEIRW